MASSSYIQSIYSSTSALIDMKKALVLGFTKKRLLKLIPLLTLHGIKVDHHIPFFKTQSDFPSNLDLVIVSTTNNSHACRGFVSQARKDGLLVLFLGDSKSKARQVLLTNGFDELSAEDVIPNVVTGAGIIGSLTGSIATRVQNPIPGSLIPTPMETLMPKKPKQKEITKKELPDLVPIKDASTRTSVVEAHIKDFINQSDISYIVQEDTTYVSVEEILQHKKKKEIEPTMTRDHEVNTLFVPYLHIVSKEINAFGYEFNRKLSSLHKELVGESRRPKLWKKALRKVKDALGIKLTSQYDSTHYGAEIDAVKYNETCLTYNLEGVDLRELNKLEYIVVNNLDKKQEEEKTETVVIPQKQKDLSLQEMIEMIRKEMKKQSIVRLDISEHKVEADMVRTVTLDF